MWKIHRSFYLWICLCLNFICQECLSKPHRIVWSLHNTPTHTPLQLADPGPSPAVPGQMQGWLLLLTPSSISQAQYTCIYNAGIYAALLKPWCPSPLQPTLSISLIYWPQHPLWPYNPPSPIISTYELRGMCQQNDHFNKDTFITAAED